MKLSVITPTEGRPRFLNGLYSLLKNQTYPDWEWLIYDTSDQKSLFSDPRVIYIHDPVPLSIGEKRNRLIEKARGEVIVHCDDDDYYAPTYLETVARQFRDPIALFKFDSWFSYDLKNRQIYYFCARELTQSRYVLSAYSSLRIREIEFVDEIEARSSDYNRRAEKGYGFSYSYLRDVAKTHPFLDICFEEDTHFFDTFQQSGYPIRTASDQAGLTIHIIHHINTSAQFPQFRLPQFIVKPLIPQFFTHIEPFHED